MTACSVLFATSDYLQRNIHFSFLFYSLKSTFKNGCHCHDCCIWHHPSFFNILVKKKKNPKLVFYSSFETNGKVTDIYINSSILV